MSGVYQIKARKRKSLMYIGRASNLRRRVKQGIVRGNGRHHAGKKIRKNENVSKLRIQWALTKRPAAVEEELHKKYSKRFGKLPKYVSHT